MKMFNQVTVPVMLLTILWSSPLVAQDLAEGEWRVMMWTPGGEVATAVYDVENVGGSPRATMKWRGGEIDVADLRVDGDLMTFNWNPGFYLQCRLERSSKGQYAGACRDSQENLGPAVFSPPGVEISPEDVDPDIAFDLWGVDREEYLRSRYPQAEDVLQADIPELEELPSRMIDIDGRRLNLVEVGSGDVTVVLESAVGDDHVVWRQVQEALSEHARVVAYDRAGLGLSDPPSSDARSSSDMAEDLHELLAAAGYAPPFLLVGHQSGAFTVRAFQSAYPNDVAGLVLVDPAHEDEDDSYRQIDADGWERYLSRKRTFYSAVSNVAAREFEAYERELQASGDEGASWTVDVPVVVLSGSEGVDHPRWVGETPEGLQAKADLHRALAATLNGEVVFSTASSGNLHLEDPELVVDAIKKVLDSVRK